MGGTSRITVKPEESSAESGPSSSWDATNGLDLGIHHGKGTDSRSIHSTAGYSEFEADDDRSFRTQSSADIELLSAAGIGVNDDDPTLPCLTIRMWTIAVVLTIVVSGLNTLYTLRKPSITIVSAAVQLVAFPIGRTWEKLLPNLVLTVFGHKLELNPGPFNEKEHILIYIMSNLSYAVRLSADTLTEQQMFFGLKAGWGFQILMTFGTMLTGFTLAGLARTLIVKPAKLVWPGLLANTALNQTLHHPNKAISDLTWKMSRYRFFMIAFAASFLWYFLPGFIFTALGYFTFLCWIWPNSPVVNQLFGMESGLGMVPLTFDWSQIAYIGSPLVVPSWAILNIAASLVLWIYIISPALYYSNTFYSAFLPLQSSSVYDRFGKTYNATKVITSNYDFDEEKYNAYSPLYLPITYAISNFGLEFAAVISLVVWFALEHQPAIKKCIHLIKEKVHTRGSTTATQGHYLDVPTWWYLVTAVISIFLLIFTCEYWPVQLPWYGVILGLAISAVLFVPYSLVYATTNTKISIDALCRVIAGYAFKGKVLANIWFFDIGYITGVKGLAFAQDLKLGLYCNIPPRSLFIVQMVGMVVSTLSQVAVLNWALGNIDDVCHTKAPDGFTCPYSRTHFNTSLIWGAIGPQRFFSSESVYHPLLWFFLIGALLPIPVFLLKRRYPNSIWQYVHVPLFLGALNYIPPASGTNYGSWIIVGLLGGVVVRKRAYPWWKKYNFVLSAALDCSVAVCGVLIFFAFFYSAVSKKFSWWGTTVHENTCDWNSCSYKSLAKGEAFGR